MELHSGNPMMLEQIPDQCSCHQTKPPLQPAELVGEKHSPPARVSECGGVQCRGATVQHMLERPAG